MPFFENLTQMRNLSFRSLGLLNYMHIWHDNSGPGASASWFLKYIIVQDLQTMQKFYFICQNWFAVEKDDGVVSIQCFSSDQSKTTLICRLNEYYPWRVNIKDGNFPISYRNKLIIVSQKVICGFLSSLDHLRINLHVCNDVLAVLFYY